MLRPKNWGVLLAALTVAAAFSLGAAQEQGHVEAIFARARVFPDVGPGVSAIKRDLAGRYYILATPATSIGVYGPEGKRTGSIPNANSKLVYAQDMDIDATGRVFVADRGANAVKVFEPDGTLDTSVKVAGPMSIAALSGDQFAVALLQSDRLVSVFDLQGKLVRSFGEISNASAANSDNPALNQGRLFGDAVGHLYFAFTGTPDPTIRAYDRFGYAAFEVALPSSWFSPRPESGPLNRITIGKNAATASTKPTIGAIAVDPETQRIWAAVGDELIEFDKDGTRRASYRTATADGVRIDASAVLIERNRILVADDPLGIFDFARPDKLPPASSAH